MNLKFAAFLWVASCITAQHQNHQGLMQSITYPYRDAQWRAGSLYHSQGSTPPLYQYSPKLHQVHSFSNGRHYPSLSTFQQYMSQMPNRRRPTNSYTGHFSHNQRRISNTPVQSYQISSGSVRQYYPSSVQGSAKHLYSASYPGTYTNTVSGTDLRQEASSRSYTPLAATRNSNEQSPAVTPSISGRSPVTADVAQNGEISLSQDQNDLEIFTFGESMSAPAQSRRQRSRTTNPERFSAEAYPAVPGRPFQDSLPQSVNQTEQTIQESESSVQDDADSKFKAIEITSDLKMKPAWQGKIQGFPVTKCHNGELFGFRQRCDKKKDCLQGEDEVDCDWYKDSSVESISTPDELNQLMESQSPLVLEFFAPWCPACITFLPHLESIKNNLQSLNVTMRKVNTDEAPILKQRFNVDTFPRVVVWRSLKDEPRAYNKSLGMTSEKITPWIMEQLTQD